MRDRSNQYSVNVLIKGQPVTEYVGPDGNIYLEGRKGSEYELQFYNSSPERVLCIPSVDGLSTLDGKSAGIDSQGYVVQPWATLRIPGWTLDSQSVAKFKFGSVESGYNVQSGEGTANSGVIGFMVFREAVTQYTNNWNTRAYPQWGTAIGGSLGAMPVTYSANATSASCAQNMCMGSIDSVVGATTKSIAATVPEIGTEFGKQATFNTTTMAFNKRDPNVPDAVIVAYYDTLKGLERRGIVVRKTGPDPFPRYKGSTGCTPPAGWTK